MRRIWIGLIGWLVGAALIAGSAFGTGANQIGVSVPAHAAVGRSYNVTVHGFSSRVATAYLFIDYTGCARSFTAEYQRASKELERWRYLRGAFSKVSGWSSNTALTDHACAWLIAKGSKKVLATDHVSFKIH